MTDDIFDQRKIVFSPSPSSDHSIVCFSAGADRFGSAQPVERYIPPPPPTTEEDIFGEAVAKGENFERYHRAQVKCTPEGPFTLPHFHLLLLLLLQAEFVQSNCTKKRIYRHRFYRIFVALISKNQRRSNVTRFHPFVSETISWHVLRRVQGKRYEHLLLSSLRIESF